MHLREITFQLPKSLDSYNFGSTQTFRTFPSPPKENFGSELCHCPSTFQFEYARKFFFGGGILHLSEYEFPKRQFMFTSRHGVTSQEHSATPLWEIQNEMSILHCVFISHSSHPYDCLLGLSMFFSWYWIN